MKRSHFWILTALLLVSCGGGDDGTGPGDDDDDNPDDPVPTAVGTPNGTPTTQSIGPAGGTLTSSDGLFSITIPAGALASPAAPSSAGGETEITIQPITNTAWGGVGSGYRLLPDGIEFAVPVELNFSLEDSMLWGSDTMLVDVGRQKDDGVWGVLKSRRIDWEMRTMTCTTSHFSDYSLMTGMQLRPAAASIGTLGNVELYVRYCHRRPIAGDPDLAALVMTCDPDLAPLNTFTNWSVNAIAGGNASLGTVVKRVPSGARARYTAPASVPNPNPVTVSVQVSNSRGTMTLLSNITIGGLWYGTVTMKQGNAQSVAEVVWEQKASYQGLEMYRPLSGIVRYEPETDYGPVCDFVSMDPREADILADYGVLFIDWNETPALAYGYGETAPEDGALTCFTCDGWDQPECNFEQLPGWFAADSLFVSANGDAIFFEFTDNGALPPRYTKIDFKKGLPPAPLTAKR